MVLFEKNETKGGAAMHDYQDDVDAILRDLKMGSEIGFAPSGATEEIKLKRSGATLILRSVEVPVRKIITRVPTAIVMCPVCGRSVASKIMSDGVAIAQNDFPVHKHIRTGLGCNGSGHKGNPTTAIYGDPSCVLGDLNNFARYGTKMFDVLAKYKKRYLY